MPKGPQGQWRPADPIACAMHVGKVATGEIEEVREAPAPKMPLAKRKVRARKGGLVRAASLTPERRNEIAAASARARWKR